MGICKNAKKYILREHFKWLKTSFSSVENLRFQNLCHLTWEKVVGKFIILEAFIKNLKMFCFNRTKHLTSPLCYIHTTQNQLFFSLTQMRYCHEIFSWRFQHNLYFPAKHAVSAQLEFSPRKCSFQKSWANTNYHYAAAVVTVDTLKHSQWEP